MMLYRPLGASGIEASVVGLGAWAIGGWMWGGTDQNDSINAIHAALDNGINLIDTAPIYGFGLSEQIVGQAIKNKRDKVVLATKCGLVWDKQKGVFYFNSDEKSPCDYSSTRKVYKYLHPDSISDEIENSLTRLATDYIDLYQTHRQDSTTAIEDTMAALLRLKDQGKIRAIGVSNVTVEQLNAYGPIDTAQERYSIFDDNIVKNNVLPYCLAHNIAVLAYSPLEQGLLTGKISAQRNFAEGDQRNKKPAFSQENRKRVNDMLTEFQPFAKKHNATIGQLVIAWTFAQPGLTHVLCGARNAHQAIENAQAGSLNLTPDDTNQMSNIAKASFPQGLPM